jgi:hypothetical protein
MQATWSKNIDSLTYVVDHAEEVEEEEEEEEPGGWGGKEEVDAGVCGKILWPAAV